MRCSHRWPIAIPSYVNTMSNHPCRREGTSEVPRLGSTKEFVRGYADLEQSAQRTLDKTFGLFTEHPRSLITVSAICWSTRVPAPVIPHVTYAASPGPFLSR